MKISGGKVVSALLIFFILSYNVHAWASPGGEKAAPAQAAIVMEQYSERVLFEQNADERLPMASTTKVMTALVALENAALDDVVTVDERASGIEGSSLYLEAGERLSVEELLCGLLIRSGNDAAVALAIHIGGSVAGFVDMMNARAAQMGLCDTHFENPNGLPADGHYTSARDLARIACEAMGNEDFRRIVSTERVQIPWDGHQWDRVLTNKNKILSLVEGGDGVKTGYTKEAGRCLVASASQEGMRLISVTLNCPDDFNVNAAFLQDGFDSYDMAEFFGAGDALAAARAARGEVALLCAGEVALPVKAGEEISFVIDAPERLASSVKAGQEAGALIALADGREAARFVLVAACDAGYGGFWENIRIILDAW